jgi:hypothetical protein
MRDVDADEELTHDWAMTDSDELPNGMQLRSGLLPQNDHWPGLEEEGSPSKISRILLVVSGAENLRGRLTNGACKVSAAHSACCTSSVSNKGVEIVESLPAPVRPSRWQMRNRSFERKQSVLDRVVNC